MATYYTATSGNDGNPGTIGSPFRTVAHGTSVLAPGDTLYVRAGTYVEHMFGRDGTAIPSGTSWANPVTVAAYPGSAPYETVWMQSDSSNFDVMSFTGSQQYIVIDGINMDGTGSFADVVKVTDGFPGENAHHIRLKNLEVKNPGVQDINTSGVSVQTGATAANGGGGNEFINLVVHAVHGGTGGQGDGSHGFYISGPNTLIERCDIYDCHGACVQIQANYIASDNNIVRKNRCHDPYLPGDAFNRRWGIVVSTDGSTTTNNLIYDNVIYNIADPGGATPHWGYGVHVFHGDNTQVYNNTIYHCGTDGILIELATSATRITNNISYGNAGLPINNLATDATLTANLTTNPLFANTGTVPPDLHLSTGSQAIDAGITLTQQVPDDFDGVLRPQGFGYDIGAYEFAATTGGVFSLVSVIQLFNSGTTHTFPTTSHPAGHALLVGIFSDGASNVAVSSVTNTAADVFTQVPASRVGDASAAYVEWWMTLASNGNAADVVTVTMASPVFVGAACHDVSYTGTASLDAHATGTVAAGTSIGVAITTTAVSDYIAAAVAVSSSANYVPGANYVVRATPSSGNELATEDRAASAPLGTQTVGASDANGVTQLWVMSVVSLKSTTPSAFKPIGTAPLIGSGVI